MNRSTTCLAGLVPLVVLLCVYEARTQPVLRLDVAQMAQLLGGDGDDCGSGECKERDSGKDCTACKKNGKNHSKKFVGSKGEAYKCKKGAPAAQSCDMSGKIDCGDGFTLIWNSNENCSGLDDGPAEETPGEIETASGDDC